MVLLLFPSFAYYILAFEDISGTIAHVYTSDLYVTMKSKTFYYYPKPWQFALQVDTYHKMDLSCTINKFGKVYWYQGLFTFVFVLYQRSHMHVCGSKITHKYTGEKCEIIVKHFLMYFI